MFKNIRIKKLLTFSVISSSFVFCGTSASSVIKRSGSFNGFDSPKVQGGMRRTSSLGDLNNQQQSPKLTPFISLNVPRTIMNRYKSEIIFEDGIPQVVFRDLTTGALVDMDTMNNFVYRFNFVKNTRENLIMFRDVTRDNNS